MTDHRASAREMSELIRKKYTAASQTEEERYFDAAMKLILLAQEGKNRSLMLTEAAKAIHRVFGFQEVAIGTRSPEDGKYRYEAIVGHTREAEEALRTYAYTRDQMADCSDYPGVVISKYTDFTIMEIESPKIIAEEKSFNRPFILRQKRPSPDDMIEGDYIDVYIYAEKDNMIGWVELGNKRDGKLPSRIALKWIEFFSAIVGLGIRTIEILSSKREA